MPSQMARRWGLNWGLESFKGVDDYGQFLDAKAVLYCLASWWIDDSSTTAPTQIIKQQNAAALQGVKVCKTQCRHGLDIMCVSYVFYVFLSNTRKNPS